VKASADRTVDKAAVRVAFIVGLVVLSGLIFRVILIPSHFSQWAYGDAQMYNAGVHFAHEGFAAHYFLPEINPGNPHSFIANNGPNGRYSHYPALHAIVNGLLIKAAYSLGVTDDVPIKQYIQVVYLLLASMGILAYFATLRRLYGDLLAAIFGIFLLLSPWLTGYGDSLCDQPLNILLSGLFFFAVVRYWDNAIRRTFSPAIAIIAFLLSRNSIEMMPVALTFSLLYGILMSVGTQSSPGFVASRRVALRSAIAHFCASVAAPIFIGLAIHLYQSYLDFGNFNDFSAHWTALYTNRFNISSISVSRSSYLWQYLTVTANTPYFMSLVAFLLVCLVIFALSGKIEDPTCRAAVFRKLGFIFSFGAGFIAFPLLFPQQAVYMHAYTPAYVYVPVFLSGLVVVALLDIYPAGLIPESCRGHRLDSPGIRATRAIAALAWIALFAAKVSAEGIVLLASPLSVIDVDDHHEWGFFGGHPEQIAIYANPEIRRTIDQASQPTDILVFPFEQKTIEAHEVSALVEYYLQRHAVVSQNQDDLRHICQILDRDRLRLAGKFKKYVVPKVIIMPTMSAETTGAELAEKLRTYDCNSAM
jgi:hypothetical protein